MFKAVTLGYYAHNGYFASPEAKVEVDRIADLSVTWIGLDCTVMAAMVPKIICKPILRAVFDGVFHP